jgi:glutamate N-acetyltransferase/amino-acid N-acetyltransferase
MKYLNPQGFLYSAVEAAIKKPGRNDLAIIYSETSANIAGIFTTNQIKAAPVHLDIRRTRNGRGQAIVVNSGNANACTGRQGMDDVQEITNGVARHLHIDQSLVSMCSTGVIGVTLPMKSIRRQLPHLVANLGKCKVEDVAEAIMTTDSFPKISGRKVAIGNKTGRIIGICKGAGMICPSMATMLCFIMTDINVQRKALKTSLRQAVQQSFNRIVVDGDMSTNDTVMIMANGMLGNGEITETAQYYRPFRDSLFGITADLAKMIVRDGEGASKFIEITVNGARTAREAQKAAYAVAKSSLVKTALYGKDANWGRIMAALGYSGSKIREEKTDIYFGKIKVVDAGTATGKDDAATSYLKRKDISITINLKIGKASAQVYTCDLTEEYVRINAAYRT